jgi:hypothetical protein
MIHLERIDRGVRATVESTYTLSKIVDMGCSWLVECQDIQGGCESVTLVNAFTDTSEYYQAFSFDEDGRTVLEFKLKGIQNA